MESVATLVREQAFPDAPPALCGAWWQVTAGNPFYLHELLIELRQRGIEPDSPPEQLGHVTPPAVLSSLLLRLDHLAAAGAPALARAIAVLGDGATLRHAAPLAGISQPEAVDALDALSGAELLARVSRRASCTRWCEWRSTPTYRRRAGHSSTLAPPSCTSC